MPTLRLKHVENGLPCLWFIELGSVVDPRDPAGAQSFHNGKWRIMDVVWHDALAKATDALWAHSLNRNCNLSFTPAMPYKPPRKLNSDWTSLVCLTVSLKTLEAFCTAPQAFRGEKSKSPSPLKP